MVSWQSPRLIIQIEMSSLLTPDAIDRAIGDFLVGLPVQRPPDRKTARCVISNDLNAANRLARFCRRSCSVERRRRHASTISVQTTGHVPKLVHGDDMFL